MEKSPPHLRHEHLPIKHESAHDNEKSEEEEKEKNREEVDIDGFLYMSGECGLYQVYIVTLMMIISFPLGYPPMVFYFIGYDPTWVLAKDIGGNSELSVVKNSHIKIHSRDDMRRCKLNRTEWEYNFDKTTMTTDFNLICDRSWLLALSGSSFFLGWGIGSIVMGYLSDIYGRKTVMIPTLFLDLLCLFLHYFAPSVYFLVVLRFIMGVFHAGVALNSYVLVIELVGPNYRVLAANISGLTWALGSILMALKAYYIRSWRLLTVALSAPYVICFIIAFLFPESVRWLNLQGKTEKAEEILRKAAEINKRPQPNVFIKPAARNEEESTLSYIDFFKSLKVAKIVLYQGYIWLNLGMSYYTLAWAFADIGGDIYINFILASLTGIPMHALAIVLLDRYGRRKTALVTTVCLIICCICVDAMSFAENLSAYRVVLALLGKCAVALVFIVMYMWSSELYPTVVRSQGMAFNIITSRAGAALSPFVKMLDHVHPSMPFFMMSLTTLIGFVCSAALSETGGKPTRETFEDIHNN